MRTSAARTADIADSPANARSAAAITSTDAALANTQTSLDEAMGADCTTVCALYDAAEALEDALSAAAALNKAAKAPTPAPQP